MARLTDEEEQERDKKKPKLLPHAPASPSRDDCLKVFKAMTDHQAAIEPNSPETLQWAKDILAIGKSVRKLKVELVNAYTENGKTFGLLYFFKQMAINPFKLATDEEKIKFKHYKNTYDLCIDEDWDGSLSECTIPAA
jgi:hypothetical protein